MGQGQSSSANHEHDFFRSVQLGKIQQVEKAFRTDPSIVHRTTSSDRLSPLHIAAANGRLEVLSLILEKGVQPDPLNGHKQTPLMLAAIHGEVDCVQRLIQANANILMFDSLHGRTSLHYAAYYGHVDCLRVILSSASSTSVAASWGFARFVNIRDGNGATPLHLAARQRRAECVRELLDKGALVSASTGNYICPGSTPLHLAARGGSLDCVRALLARGADRLQKDSFGRSPYAVALKQNHMLCAQLLNPLSSQPLVWPSPLNIISKLNQETKNILERALEDINMEREKTLLEGSSNLSSSPNHSDNRMVDKSCEDEDAGLCCICFERPCAIEVRNCGHEMCELCILVLCCQCMPDPATLSPASPVCPFCRCSMVQLVVAEAKAVAPIPSKLEESEQTQSLCEGNKSLTSSMSSLGKLVHVSSRLSDGCVPMEKAV